LSNLGVPDVVDLDEMTLGQLTDLCEIYVAAGYDIIACGDECAWVLAFANIKPTMVLNYMQPDAPAFARMCFITLEPFVHTIIRRKMQSLRHSRADVFVCLQPTLTVTK
jgi:hypothetical protein